MGISRRGRARRAPALVAAVAVSLLSGCWLQPAYGPERQNYNPLEQSLTETNVATLHQVWSVSTSTTGGPPLVAGNTVIIGENPGAGVVRAVSRSSGTVLWEQRPGRGEVVSTAGDEVLIVSDQRVIVLDATTGATTSEVPEPSALIGNSEVAAGDGIVAYRAFRTVPSIRWELVVRSRETLAELWTAPLSQQFNMGQGSQLLVSGGRLYLQDGPDIKGFPVEGCGASACSPEVTFPVPPRAGYSDASEVFLLAATDDGGLLLHRYTYDGASGVSWHDLVALDSDGTLDWELLLRRLDGVAVAGDTVFAVGSATSSGALGRTLFARSDSGSWQAQVDRLEGTPVVAGGLVYVERGANDGSDVAIFDADGCGGSTCSELETLDITPGAGGLYGMSVAAGTLFVSKAGPGGHVSAYRP